MGESGAALQPRQSERYWSLQQASRRHRAMRGIPGPAARPLLPGRMPRAMAQAARRRAGNHALSRARKQRTTAAGLPGRCLPLLQSLPPCPFQFPSFRRSQPRWLPRPRRPRRPYRRRPSRSRQTCRRSPRQRFLQQPFRCRSSPLLAGDVDREPGSFRTCPTDSGRHSHRGARAVVGTRDAGGAARGRPACHPTPRHRTPRHQTTRHRTPGRCPAGHPR
jgi:hypothetical protein